MGLISGIHHVSMKCDKVEYESVAILLWRLYTFYLPIVVGLFFSRRLFFKSKN